MILIYTFYAWNNKTFKFLRGYENPNIKKMYIHGVVSIHKLISHIENSNYEYIIGLGDYRSNAKKIRIESKFINKFGKFKIYKLAPDFLEATLNIKPIGETYVATNTTHGPCNRSAYILSNHIYNTGLGTKLGYIHIPSGKKIEEITPIIDEIICSLKEK